MLFSYKYTSTQVVQNKLVWTPYLATHHHMEDFQMNTVWIYMPCPHTLVVVHHYIAYQFLTNALDKHHLHCICMCFSTRDTTLCLCLYPSLYHLYCHGCIQEWYNAQHVVYCNQWVASYTCVRCRSWHGITLWWIKTEQEKQISGSTFFHNIAQWKLGQSCFVKTESYLLQQGI